MNKVKRYGRPMLEDKSYAPRGADVIIHGYLNDPISEARIGISANARMDFTKERWIEFCADVDNMFCEVKKERGIE